MLAAEESGRADEVAWSRSSLRLPRRYFFSLASDYPHKNLPNSARCLRSVQGSLEERASPLTWFWRDTRRGLARACIPSSRSRPRPRA